jgi:probable rRNA maturation factor
MLLQKSSRLLRIKCANLRVVSFNSSTEDLEDGNDGSIEGGEGHPPDVGLKLEHIDIEESAKLVRVRNSQRRHFIDVPGVQQDLARIKNVLGVSPFTIDVWFCSDNKIRELNGQFRGKRVSTDVLSFPANAMLHPGVFRPDPALEFSGQPPHLGAIVVSPAYLQRMCDRDATTALTARTPAHEEQDRGVSRRMAGELDPRRRLCLLLVHSALHLIGYDHELHADWEQMTSMEDDVCERLGL